MILIKSAHRFARNTVDALKTIRMRFSAKFLCSKLPFLWVKGCPYPPDMQISLRGWPLMRTSHKSIERFLPAPCDSLTEIQSELKKIRAEIRILQNENDSEKISNLSADITQLHLYRQTKLFVTQILKSLYKPDAKRHLKLSDFCYQRF